MTAPPLEDVEFPPLESVTLDPGGAEEKPRTRRRRSDAGVPRGTRSGGTTRTRSGSSAQLEQDLRVPIAKLGQAISFSLPTVGAVLIARGEVTSKAIVSYAQGHPKMLEALHKLGKISPATDVIETVAMCIIAANLDLQRMHPAHPVAQLTGVSQIYMDMHQHMMQAEQEAENPPEAEPSPTGGFDNIQPPPVFISEGFNANGTFDAPPMWAAGESAAVRNNE